MKLNSVYRELIYLVGPSDICKAVMVGVRLRIKYEIKFMLDPVWWQRRHISDQLREA